jgi:hypothetical protein
MLLLPLLCCLPVMLVLLPLCLRVLSIHRPTHPLPGPCNLIIII